MVRIEAARRAFPVKDGGSIHGFDVIIVEENLSGGPPGGGHARRQENDASTQSVGDDSVQRRWNMTSGSCLCCHLAESQRLYGGDAGTGGGGTERVCAPLGIKPTDLRWRENSFRPKELNGIKRREFGSGFSANVEAMARLGLQIVQVPLK